jgi:hypothetical protein
MRTGHPKRPLSLTTDEQERLQSLAHRARSKPVPARRAGVILASARFPLSEEATGRTLPAKCNRRRQRCRRACKNVKM